jgi:predicted nucleotidyltransferase
MKGIAILDEKVVSTIREYLAGHDAVQVAIFGSYARGDAGPASDIDVLVEFGAKKSLFDIVEYELALGELVGRKIELVTKPSLSPYFRNDVLSRMQVIYG